MLAGSRLVSFLGGSVLIYLMRVAVGSLNPVKVEAARLVFERFFSEVEIKPVEVETSISAQPIGIDQVIKGAVERAYQALSSVTGSDYGVGLEAGLIPYPWTITGYLNHQVCALVDHELKVTLGSSMGFEFPSRVIERLERREVREAEEVMEEITGIERIGESAGAIGYLTKNHVKRLDLSIQAITSALIPRLNPNLYMTRWPRVDEILR